jgi:hypothetical protein
VLGEFIRALTDALAEGGFKPPPRPASFESVDLNSLWKMH